MRHLAVGDIHGCFRALTTLAAYVAFQPDDVVITLGDYVNRGPQTYAVLDWLIAYHRVAKLIPLRGNHEIMMLQAREDEKTFRHWLECGGDATLASYSPFRDSGRLVDVPDYHWEFLEKQTHGWHEIETHFFVHANANATLPLEAQPETMLYWERFDQAAPHLSGKVMVCGHTPQKNGQPLHIGHAVCIDTGACRKGWLTCLDVRTGQYWQANQQGKTRTGKLEQVVGRVTSSSPATLRKVS